MGAAYRALHVSRAGYYQRRSGKAGGRITENQRISGLVQEIHRGSPDKGYRRIRDDLDRYYQTPVNDKRALRICRSLGIRSMVKHAPQGCTRSSSSPRHLAENVLICPLVPLVCFRVWVTVWVWPVHKADIRQGIVHILAISFTCSPNSYSFKNCAAISKKTTLP